MVVKNQLGYGHSGLWCQTMLRSWMVWKDRSLRDAVLCSSMLLLWSEGRMNRTYQWYQCLNSTGMHVFAFPASLSSCSSGASVTFNKKPLKLHLQQALFLAVAVPVITNALYLMHLQVKKKKNLLRLVSENLLSIASVGVSHPWSLTQLFCCWLLHYQTPVAMYLWVDAPKPCEHNGRAY